MPHRASANTTSAGSTSLAVNMPAGIVAGDRLIAAFSFDHSAVPTVVSCGPNNRITGWLSLGSQTCTQDGETQWLFERVADGTEGATQTFSINASTPTSVHVDAFSGRSSAALTFSQPSKDDSNLTSAISASITGGTAAAGDDVGVYIAVDQQAAAARWSRSVSGYTNRGTVAERDWSSSSSASADSVGAGATGSIAATLTRTTGTGNAAWMAWVVSIPADFSSGVVDGAVALAGSAALAVQGASIASGAPSLAGAAGLAVTGRSIASGAPALAGAAGLAVQGASIVSASVAMSGGAGLAVTGRSVASVAVALTGSLDMVVLAAAPTPARANTGGLVRRVGMRRGRL